MAKRKPIAAITERTAKRSKRIVARKSESRAATENVSESSAADSVLQQRLLPDSQAKGMAISDFQKGGTLRASVNRNEARARSGESSTIPTCSRILRDGSFLEIVRGTQVGSPELLVHWANGQSSMNREFAADNFSYVPSEGARLMHHLPSMPVPYGSATALFDEVAGFIARHSGLDQEGVAMLTFFCIASFFCDCLNMAPCLLLFGAPVQVMSVFRILECICRHAILLAGSSVHGLPAELRPTRLVCQTDASFDKQLAALQFPGVNILGGPRQVSGASAIYAGDAEMKTPFADVCFGFPVVSAAWFAFPDEQLELPAITSIQNKLLMHRFQMYPKVRASRFDVPEFSGFTREFARTLGVCVVDAPDLQARLIDLLRPHDEADRTKCTATLPAVVLEALVVCCHERKPSVHVGDITFLANKILKERGETVELSPKQVGGRLKELGIRTMRLDSGGRGLYLLNEECARIHELGRTLGVATLREGLPGCPYCTK